MSFASGLQKTLKLLHVAALNEEAVRIDSVWQEDTESRHALSAKATRQLLCRELATSVGVGIEGNIDGSRAVAELLKLPCIWMTAQ
jgi:hypothetical protein